MIEVSGGSGADAGRGVVGGAGRLNADSKAGAEARFGSFLASSNMNCNIAVQLVNIGV